MLSSSVIGDRFLVRFVFRDLSRRTYENHPAENSLVPCRVYSAIPISGTNEWEATPIIRLYYIYIFIYINIYIYIYVPYAYALSRNRILTTYAPVPGHCTKKSREKSTSFILSTFKVTLIFASFTDSWWENRQVADVCACTPFRRRGKSPQVRNELWECGCVRLKTPSTGAEK